MDNRETLVSYVNDWESFESMNVAFSMVDVAGDLATRIER